MSAVTGPSCSYALGAVEALPQSAASFGFVTSICETDCSTSGRAPSDAMTRAVVLCGHSHRQSLTQIPGGPLIRRVGRIPETVGDPAAPRDAPRHLVADVSAAVGAETGVQIGAAFVTNVVPWQFGDAEPGTSVTLTIDFSQPLTINTSGGPPLVDIAS
jgi:hypothetical protein